MRTGYERGLNAATRRCLRAPKRHLKEEQTMDAPMIELFQTSKEFMRGDAVVRAVDDVSLVVGAGEFVSMVGKSGSRKSTLLHLMSGLLTPTHGTVRLQGRELGSMTDNERTVVRRDVVGFIFQFFNLLPTLTAEENVSLPLLLAGKRERDAAARALEVLNLVGLADRASYKADRLSGGEMQRVAIARALVNRPPVIFADEPTGNLDTVSGEEVLTLIKNMQVDQGVTVVLVTHDAKAAAYADRVLTLRDGRVAEDIPTATLVGAGEVDRRKES